MRSVGIREAKTHLSALLRDVEAGEEVEIRRGSEPIAKLVPIPAQRRERILGIDRGRVTISDDFDAPLPDDLLDAFEGL